MIPLSQGGIPPSPDREDRLLLQAVLGVILVVLFFTVMYLVLGASDQFSREVGVTGTNQESKLENYLQEKERASAYAFLRDHLDQRREEPTIAAVYCRDSSHRWLSGRIEFTGDVDFEGPAGRLRRHTYVALISGSAQDGWVLESIRLGPPRPPAP
jgi:hypothetical protein